MNDEFFLDIYPPTGCPMYYGMDCETTHLEPWDLGPLSNPPNLCVDVVMLILEFICPKNFGSLLETQIEPLMTQSKAFLTKFFSEHFCLDRTVIEQNSVEHLSQIFLKVARLLLHPVIIRDQSCSYTDNSRHMETKIMKKKVKQLLTSLASASRLVDNSMYGAPYYQISQMVEKNRVMIEAVVTTTKSGITRNWFDLYDFERKEMYLVHLLLIINGQLETKTITYENSYEAGKTLSTTCYYETDKLFSVDFSQLWKYNSYWSSCGGVQRDIHFDHPPDSEPWKKLDKELLYIDTYNRAFGSVKGGYELLISIIECFGANFVRSRLCNLHVDDQQQLDHSISHFLWNNRTKTTLLQ
jgi:hypothetical protein